MQLTSVQAIFAVITIISVLAPGIVAARRIKSADDYDVGGRSAGSVMVAGTILGTIVGGSATVGTAQLGSTMGLTAWWFTLGSGIALVLMAAFYASPMRKSGLTTISEFLASRYGAQCGPIVSLSASAGTFFSLVASSITSMHLIAAVTGLHVWEAAVLVLVIVTGIVYKGGISGSALSGLLKMAIIFGTVFVGAVQALGELGGFGGVLRAFPEAHWYSLFGRGVEAGLYNLVAMIAGVISTQTYVQALFSSQDARTAVKGCLLAAAIAVPVGLPCILIGMYMHLQHPEMATVYVLPQYLLTYLPEWLGGIAIAGLVFTAIGSLAGLGLGMGTMLSRDIVHGCLHVQDSGKLLAANRGIIVAATVAALAVALCNMDSLILEWNYASMALRASAVFLPLTVAVLLPRLHLGRMGFYAMLAGVFVALTWKLIVPTASNSLFPSLAANLLFLIPGVLLSWRHHG